MIVGNDPILLTPGPLTTSLATKQAMLRDWGSWDAAFNSVTASLRKDLVDIVGGGSDYTCVPLQGSGTFSVEAAIGTLVPRDGKVLVPNNGAYCARIIRICSYLGRAVVELPVAGRPAGHSCVSKRRSRRIRRSRMSHRCTAKPAPVCSTTSPASRRCVRGEEKSDRRRDEFVRRASDRRRQGAI